MNSGIEEERTYPPSKPEEVARMNRWHRGPVSIPLTEAEAKSGFDRVRWAESLILQFPQTHEGRNSWLLNFGTGEEANSLRTKWESSNGRSFPSD